MTDRTCTTEVMVHLSRQDVRAVALTPSRGLARGMAVTDTGHPLQTPVGEQLVGRMLDVFGHPLEGPLEFVEQRPLLRHPLPLDSRTVESGLF